jgi:hypothetical protein
MASTPEKTYINTFKILCTKKFVDQKKIKKDPKIPAAL